jgi:hypothetical protein
MFFCEECRVERGWPESFSQSQGPCELCKKHAVCHNVPSRALPDPKPVSVRELRKEPEEPEEPERKSAWERIGEDD